MRPGIRRQALGDQHLGDRGKQEGIRTGADRQVLIRNPGGPRAARIDHHQSATAPAQRPQPAR